MQETWQDDLRACYGSLANVALDYALCQYLPTLPSVTLPTGTSGAGSSSSTAPPAGASGVAPSTTSPIRTRGARWCSPSLTCGKRPEQASLLNLAALCQRCHLNWDRREHGFNRLRNRIARLMRQGQIPLCLPREDSLAMALYDELGRRRDLAAAPAGHAVGLSHFCLRVGRIAPLMTHSCRCWCGCQADLYDSDRRCWWCRRDCRRRSAGFSPGV